MRKGIAKAALFSSIVFWVSAITLLCAWAQTHKRDEKKVETVSDLDAKSTLTVRVLLNARYDSECLEVTPLGDEL